MFFFEYDTRDAQIHREFMLWRMFQVLRAAADRLRSIWLRVAMAVASESVIIDEWALEWETNMWPMCVSVA